MWLRASLTSNFGSGTPFRSSSPAGDSCPLYLCRKAIGVPAVINVIIDFFGKDKVFCYVNGDMSERKKIFIVALRRMINLPLYMKQGVIVWQPRNISKHFLFLIRFIITSRSVCLESNTIVSWKTVDINLSPEWRIHTSSILVREGRQPWVSPSVRNSAHEDGKRRRGVAEE